MEHASSVPEKAPGHKQVRTRLWGGEAEDAIEHYCRCTAVHRTLQQVLRISVPVKRGLTFWMLDFPKHDGELICSALSTYACYNAFNHNRCAGKRTNIETSIDAMRQHIIQAVAGTPSLGKCLDNRWAEPLPMSFPAAASEFVARRPVPIHVFT